MESNKVKKVFQDAFDEFKDQFDEFIIEEKRKTFSNLFKVTADIYGNLHVDNIYIGVNIKDCGDILSSSVDIECINIFISTYKKLVIYMDWANDREVPSIKNIVMKINIYSSGNE